MSSANQFDWAVFYEELAGKLLPYKENRQELISKVFNIYEITGINLPLLERDNQIVDFDPFTFFGMFNKGLTTENRIKLVSAIADLFDISAPVPTSFYGVPVLNNLRANFYQFEGERDESDIDNLWGLFESALAYADTPSSENHIKFSGYFDLAVNMKYNGRGKITMGLFWIAPDSYLSLDNVNIDYIYKSGEFPEELVQNLPKASSKIPAEKYLDIVDKLRAHIQTDESSLNNFKELSYVAWRHSSELSEKKSKQQQTEAAMVDGEAKIYDTAIADEGTEDVHYWMYSPGDGAMYWDEFYETGIMGIGWDELGDLRVFSSKEQIRQRLQEIYDSTSSHVNSVLATWQFANEMKPGDVIFAKKGRYKLVGRGVVESGYEYDPNRRRYRNIRKVRWTHKGEWPHPGNAHVKTLTNVTDYTDYVTEIEALFSDVSLDIVEEDSSPYPPYDAEDFLSEVFMDKNSYETLVALVRNKSNVILQGAPGVGKTFVAERLAYSMMGVQDKNRITTIQFHQSYSYEDFIMGFRPTEPQGYKLHHGVFYTFCKRAEKDFKNDYFFIIDEINRGNMSKIFGELLMLIENDKRGEKLNLMYTHEEFYVPSNVYIIGMMNTADRSLAMLDYALRRRFAFFDLKPAFNSDGFQEYRSELDSERLDKLINSVEKLNDAITEDDSLGEGFCIGHSYFCDLPKDSETELDKALSRIVEFELIPLLKEYWFDEPGKVRDWETKLRDAVR
ncbi:MAG: AAA domain-containing protein [Clostridiaceae bacterium]|jgi:5-methylcytosine-specific restriction protein B|nr:AAA domain-containing protein [Clostridiaceae bacterium]